MLLFRVFICFLLNSSYNFLFCVSFCLLASFLCCPFSVDNVINNSRFYSVYRTFPSLGASIGVLSYFDGLGHLFDPFQTALMKAVALYFIFMQFPFSLPHFE
jgi:hypothetical protein